MVISLLHLSAARALREDDGKRKERLLTVQLPCIAGVSERNRRVSKDFNIRAVFKSGPTLRSKVENPSPTLKQANRSTVYLEKGVHW